MVYSMFWCLLVMFFFALNLNEDRESPRPLIKPLCNYPNKLLLQGRFVEVYFSHTISSKNISAQPYRHSWISLFYYILPEHTHISLHVSVGFLLVFVWPLCPLKSIHQSLLSSALLYILPSCLAIPLCAILCIDWTSHYVFLASFLSKLEYIILIELATTTFVIKIEIQNWEKCSMEWVCIKTERNMNVE